MKQSDWLKEVMLLAISNQSALFQVVFLKMKQTDWLKEVMTLAAFNQSALFQVVF